MENLFIEASRKQLRFSTTSGQLNVEDLWDLSLTSLDTIAKGLNKQVKEAAEESFIKTRSAANKVLELKLEIVKYVIKVKMAEAEEKANAVEKKAKKEKLLSLIAEKQDEGLKAKSIEELQKELEAI